MAAVTAWFSAHGWVLVAAIVKSCVVIFGVFGLGGLLTWADRRQSAMLQHRLGPSRANIGSFKLWGLTHLAADGIKMMMKEDFIPARGDRLVHGLAPLLSAFPVCVVFCMIPFADDLHPGHIAEVLPASPEGMVIPMQVARLNVGILFMLAIASTGILGMILGGWSSDNRFGIIGAQRAMNQLVSYEMALGLSLIGPLLVYGTMEMHAMVKWQEAHLWGLVVQPLAFVLFMVAGIAETKRVPFDMPEGESELAAGFHIAYGSMKFAMFFLGEYVEVAILSGILVTLFLGGWSLPGLTPAGLAIDCNVLGIHWAYGLPHWLVLCLQAGVFAAKVIAVCWFQLTIRWTLPKFRYDQIMDLCWRYLTPLALLNIVATAVVIQIVK